MKIERKNKAFPHFTEKERSRKYARIQDIYASEEREELGSFTLQSFFRAYFGETDKVLDLGSGNGGIFEVFNGLGLRNTHGADIAKYLSTGKPKKSFKTFDFSFDKYPYKDKTFDALTAIEVVEHLENPFHFFREAHRILKKDGIFVISTPNVDHLYTKLVFFFRGWFHRFLPGNDHISPFSKITLEKGVLPYFKMLARAYWRGEMPYRLLSKFRWPENRFFGRTAIYVLKNK